MTVFMSPIFLCLWGAICAPIRFVLGLSSFVGYIYKYMYDVVGGIWMFVSSVLKVASSAEAATKHTYEVSLWRALWNDLFSQVSKFEILLFVVMPIKPTSIRYTAAILI